MRIFNPEHNELGLPMENTFCVADELNYIVSSGYITYSHLPLLFPERPISIYLNIQTQGIGLDMLMGALIARAEIIREQFRQIPCRIFTRIDPQDEKLLQYLYSEGFDTTDSLDLYQLNFPDAKNGAPMGYQLGTVPLNSQQEVYALLQRLNSFKMNVISISLFQRLMQTPHFSVFYIAKENEIVGEIVLAGQDNIAKVIALYIQPKYQKMGMAKTLLYNSMLALNQRGVNYFEGEVIRRNFRQNKLAQSCKATFIHTLFQYPGINI